MTRKPSRLEIEMAYAEGLWQTVFFEFGGNSYPQKIASVARPTVTNKRKRGRPQLSLEEQEESNRKLKEWRKEYHKKYYLTVTKPKRKRRNHDN